MRAEDLLAVTREGAVQTAGQLWIAPDLGGRAPGRQCPRERFEESGIGTRYELAQQIVGAACPIPLREPVHPRQLFGKKWCKELRMISGDISDEARCDAHPLLS